MNVTRVSGQVVIDSKCLVLSKSHMAEGFAHMKMEDQNGYFKIFKRGWGLGWR